MWRGLATSLAVSGEDALQGKVKELISIRLGLGDWVKRRRIMVRLFMTLMS
jgi:hypothetical protein